MSPAPAHLQRADVLAAQAAELLEAVESCSDIDQLKTALRVVVVALPELVISTDPMEAVIDTVRRAVSGTWP